MGTRAELLEHLWETVINSSLEPTALENMVAATGRDPTGPFADGGAAVARMLEAGVSPDDIRALIRSSSYEAVFATLYSLDDPGADDEDVFMLHEELLGADPTGMEGRPGSAAKWRNG